MSEGECCMSKGIQHEKECLYTALRLAPACQLQQYSESYSYRYLLYRPIKLAIAIYRAAANVKEVLAQRVAVTLELLLKSDLPDYLERTRHLKSLRFRSQLAEMDH